ncbi:MAG: zinc transporter ZupT [Clostridiaceae bacterium]|nr:zinc transporter ZupT [Clostridiaceae bacterium]
MDSDLILSICLATLAGLSTGIGGLVAVLFKRTNTKVLSIMLGFSAGIMIYISFIELYQESLTNLCNIHGPVGGKILTALAFFFGITLMALINEFIPEPNHPHRARKIESVHKMSITDSNKNAGKLLRTGIFTAIAVTLHNFPEGIASYVSTMKNSALGASIALAIAIHNIPEGIAVSIPVYYATGSRKKALFASLFSGLSEPLGAIIAMAVLGPLITDTMFGIIFGAVAGIMVYISLDELLPTSREYGEHNLSILGIMLGMALMAISVIFIF